MPERVRVACARALLFTVRACVRARVVVLFRAAQKIMMDTTVCSELGYKCYARHPRCLCDIFQCVRACVHACRLAWCST